MIRQISYNTYAPPPHTHKFTNLAFFLYIQFEQIRQVFLFLPLQIQQAWHCLIREKWKQGMMEGRRRIYFWGFLSRCTGISGYCDRALISCFKAMKLNRLYYFKPANAEIVVILPHTPTPQSPLPHGLVWPKLRVVAETLGCWLSPGNMQKDSPDYFPLPDRRERGLISQWWTGGFVATLAQDVVLVCSPLYPNSCFSPCRYSSSKPVWPDHQNYTELADLLLLWLVDVVLHCT